MDRPDNIKALIAMESVAREKLDAEKARYCETRKPLSDALTELVCEYCNVFKLLAYRARKIDYAIPEVKSFFDFDYGRDMEQHIKICVSDLLPVDTKDGFVRITGKDYAVDRDDPDRPEYLEFSIHIPVQYLELDGLYSMRKDGLRISKELDSIEKDTEAKHQHEQENQDRTVFETLNKRFG